MRTQGPEAWVERWRYGRIDEAVAWDAAMRFYFEDRLDAALRAAEELAGAAMGAYLSQYRVIEAEQATRLVSRSWRAAEWLTVESPPNESVLDEPALAAEVLDACDDVAETFGWRHGPQTWVTFLTAEVDGPWLPTRHGYCIDKNRFTKICLPVALTGDREELAEAVRHEYAHVMTGHRTAGRCPRWLDEAVAMTAERADLSFRDFATGHAAWRGPRDLDAAFREDRESVEGSQVVRQAYRQAAALGATLVGRGGPAKLGALLDAFADNSFLTEVALRLTGQDYAGEALRQVYGLSTDGLFAEARKGID